MKDNSVWPPPPTNQIQPEQPQSSPLLFFRIPALATGVGLGLALLDIRITSDLVDWLSMGAAAILGYQQPKAFWLSVFILTAYLYMVHVIAIVHGAHPPFVEPDTYSAQETWISLYPNGLCGLVGATVGYFVKRQARR